MRQTTLAPQEFVALVQKHWPELSRGGAKMLAAQWAAETRRGANCYNYNFGNMKQPNLKEPHMFLHGTWELYGTEAAASKAVETSHGLARLATDQEKKAKGVPLTKPMVVFSPPHGECSFRAYASADAGMADYVAKQKSIAHAHPEYLDALNSGDAKQMAHVLAKVHYATQDEAAYRGNLASQKRWIDAQLETKTTAAQPHSV